MINTSNPSSVHDRPSISITVFIERIKFIFGNTFKLVVGDRDDERERDTLKCSSQSCLFQFLVFSPLVPFEEVPPHSSSSVGSSFSFFLM